MPKSERERLKRKFGSVDKNLAWALEHLDQLGLAYSEHHPDVSQMIATYMEGLLMAKAGIKQLADSL